jgi:hypothetical protein
MKHQAHPLNRPFAMLLACAALSCSLQAVAATVVPPPAQANVIKQPPIIAKLQKLKQPLSKETNKWMKRWVGVNLDNPGFVYNELGGTTEIYLKISKIDILSSDGYKAYGTFITGHGSSNPDAEIAYFNLAAILGHDDIIRPAVPYTLGKKAAQGFKLLLDKEFALTLPGDRRHDVRIPRLLDWLKKPPLIGGLKAKKPDSSIIYKFMADIPPGAARGVPFKTNPVIKALQAGNPQPVANDKILLQAGYIGDLLELAREYSIIMTLDVIFQQWDRYNNTNVGLAKDNMDMAHFFITDNGGADMGDIYLADLKRNLSYFSRYDRKTISKLTELYVFLANPAKGFMGYKNAELFVVDLGLCSELKPAEYVRLLKRNLQLLLNHVAAAKSKYGINKIYLP